MPQHPPAAETFFDLGYQHLKKLDFAQAAPCFQAALALAPGFLEAHVNLGWSLEKLGSLDEAEASYRRALALDPACLRAGLNLGVLLVGRKRFADAEEVYAQTLRDHPDAAAAWSNLGVLETLAKREVEAEAHLRKAMALDPGYARARFNLSYLLLRQGRFEEGWPALEARELSPFTARFAFPPWRGEDLRGKSLLIGIEKGHGDMLQFCRYVPLLKARGAARIGLVCHGALARLLRPMEGLDALFPLEDGIPTDGWDHWTLPLSLPLHCGTRMDTIP
ncbi:MAG TPA: tetratricopeptide repeat protein, partial [Holophaga sp.]|nr:tetratricopeptide repeat protein [Holophaga sp.]